MSKHTPDEVPCGCSECAASRRIFTIANRCPRCLTPFTKPPNERAEIIDKALAVVGRVGSNHDYEILYRALCVAKEEIAKAEAPELLEACNNALDALHDHDPDKAIDLLCAVIDRAEGDTP